MSLISTKRVIRVFISSPSDVRPERAIVRRVIARLCREFGHHFEVEAVMWEREPLLASASFQAGIAKPHETDIVVVVLWSRLGVLLAAADQPGPLSRRNVTGTEWEFEDALAGYKRTGERPELLLYRKTAKKMVELGNDAEIEDLRHQRKQVEDFVRRWTLDADGSAFTAASRSFIDGGEFEGLVEDHLRGLLQKRLGAGAETGGKVWHEAPYRGLEAFEPEHEQIFFGRTRARNELRELLARQVARGAAFVLVVGASGSGKSSLVRAGLVPDLAEAGMIGRVGLVRIAITRPGAAADPLSALAAALLASGALPELKGTPLDYTEARLTGLLRDAPEHAAQPIRQGLSAAGRVAGLTRAGEARLLLVIDQLEELFTGEGVEVMWRERFVSALEALARSGLVWVVATLRSDFFNRLDQVPALVRLSEGEARYLLLPPNAGEISQIVRQPARESGLRFEVDSTTGENLADTIVSAAASDPASLPLLEYLLDQLWRRREPGGVLGFAAYRALGGLEGAIGARAEEVLAAQPVEVQAELPRLLRALVTVGQGAGAIATARNADIARFAPGTPGRRLIEALLASEARLLVADGGTIRVAHEALLRHWGRARQQIAEDRADLQLRTRLEEAQTRWRIASETDRHSLLLAPGLPLAEARDLVSRRGDELAGEVTEYVSKSAEADDARRDAELRAAQELAAERTRAAEAAEKLAAEQTNAANLAERVAAAARTAAEQSEKARRRTLGAAAVVALLLVVAIAGGAYAIWAEKRAVVARDAALISQSRYVADAAHELNGTGDCGTALALALEVLPTHFDSPDRPWEIMAEGRLQEAVWCLRQRKILAGHEASTTSAMYSSDASQVLTASWDKTARLWDARSGRELAVLRGHEEVLWSAVFSPDGLQVLTASEDKTARLWDARSGRQLAVLRGHEDAVHRAVFSPDGMNVLTASSDKTARLWDARSGRELVVLRGHENWVTSVMYSADGSQVLTAAAFDNTVRLWDARSGRELAVLRGHEGGVISAVFSPDGLQVLTASQDKTARLWDGRSGRQLAVLRGHEDLVFKAVYSKDGSQVATASKDMTARLWDAHSGREVAVLRGHEGSVIGAVFSPDGMNVLTASDDKTARLWDARSGRELAVLRGHENRVASAMYSPDGSQIITASWDKTARLWDARSSPELAVLRGHEREVTSAVFSPDGSQVLTASMDKTARLWNARSGRELTVLRGHEDGLSRVAFSPDGSQVLTASKDGTARLWDARSGRELAVLRGHENRVNSAVYSPDGSQVLAVLNDNTLRLWDARSGRELAVLRGYKEDLWSAVYSPDGSQVLAVLGDYTLRLMDARSGRELKVLRGHLSAVYSAVYSPDRSQILTASYDKTARLWDARSGVELAVLRGHEDGLWSAVYSPDGLQVLTASKDETVRLWDARSGRELAVLRGLEGGVFSAVFSPGGSQVLMASGDNTVRLWSRTRGQELLDQARDLQPHPLTPAQRERYFLEQEPSSK